MATARQVAARWLPARPAQASLSTRMVKLPGSASAPTRSNGESAPAPGPSLHQPPSLAPSALAVAKYCWPSRNHLICSRARGRRQQAWQARTGARHSKPAAVECSPTGISSPTQGPACALLGTPRSSTAAACAGPQPTCLRSHSTANTRNRPASSGGSSTWLLRYWLPGQRWPKCTEPMTWGGGPTERGAGWQWRGCRGRTGLATVELCARHQGKATSGTGARAGASSGPHLPHAVPHLHHVQLPRGSPAAIVPMPAVDARRRAHRQARRAMSKRHNYRLCGRGCRPGRLRGAVKQCRQAALPSLQLWLPHPLAAPGLHSGSILRGLLKFGGHVGRHAACRPQVLQGPALQPPSARHAA